jgi:hypothetical protein
MMDYMRRTTWFGKLWRWFDKLPRKEKIEVVGKLVAILVGLGAICGGVYKGIAVIVRPHVATTNVPKAADTNGTGTKDTTHQTKTPTGTDGVAPVNQRQVVRTLEVPANILPLSIQNVAAGWMDRDKTVLERQQFAKENRNRPVRWVGRLDDILYRTVDDPNSPVIAFVRPPESQSDIGQDRVAIHFSPQCSHDFLFLKKGDLIEFQGTLDLSRVGDFIEVREAVLLAYVRK